MIASICWFAGSATVSAEILNGCVHRTLARLFRALRRSRRSLAAPDDLLRIVRYSVALRPACTCHCLLCGHVLPAMSEVGVCEPGTGCSSIDLTPPSGTFRPVWRTDSAQWSGFS